MDINDKTNDDLIKLHRAVESSGEAIFITDLKGLITYVNPEFTKLYGYTSDEVIGKTTPRILKSGAMAPEYYKTFWEAILNKEVVRIEYINKTKDGRQITVEGSANPILNNKDEIIGFIGVQHDITSRKRSEDALRLSEEKFRKVFMTSPDSVTINRLTDGAYVSVNDGFVKIFGYSEEEVIGKSAFELNLWADPESRNKLVSEIKERGSIENFEAIFRKKNGDIIYAIMSGSVIELDGIAHMLIIVKDVTLNKRLEESLSREKYFLNALMNNLTDFIYIKDRQSRFLRVNKSHALALGLNDPDEVIGKSDNDFYSSEHVQQAYMDEQAIVSTGKAMTKEEKLTHTDGHNTWVSTIKMPLYDNDGNIIGTFGISRDITEQKRSEEQFFLLANALKSINECVTITDMNDRVIFLNQAFNDTYGYTESDLSKAPISLIRSPNNPMEVVQEILPATLRGGWKGEILNRKKDGSDFLVSLSTAVVKNNLEEPIAMIGVATDITDRKRMELENQILYEITQGVTTTSNLDELLKLIHSSLGKVVYAENFFVALHNKETGLFSFPYFVDKFDTTPAPVSMRKSCTAYVFRTVRPLLLTQKIFDQLITRNEVELIGSNSPSWIGIPLQTPSKVVGVLVLQHYEKENVFSENDVRFLISIGSQIAFAIDRKLSETALRESEKDLNESQKISGLGSYKLDFITGTWISSQILDSIFGINNEYDKSIKGWTELIHPEWRETMGQYLQKNIIENGERFDKEYKIVRKKDGNERWVHGLGELIYDSAKKLNYMVGTIMDINRRKLAEEEIILKNKQLQVINAEKDKFFSIMAHDLRGPLSAFVGATQIINEEIETMSMEEIREITGSMKTSATNIYSLLENLLEWSRLRRGGMDFFPEKLNLKTKIEECIDVLSESGRKKDIEIVVSVPQEIEVFADNHMLDSVIRNLVSNAIKFTSAGGKVTVTTSTREDHLVEVKIADSGIGMTAELRNKLFQINEKTSRPGTAGESSTGLGLLLCKEFIEKHGGRIWVDSEIGKGSTFFFTIRQS
jgi:PAS domain S-box-containing protein